MPIQSWIKYLLLFSIIHVKICFGEGTRQVAPNASISINGNPTHDIAALLIDHDAYNNFATYNNVDPNSRLYIHIKDPTTESIYMGFSVGHVNANAPNATPLAYSYRIKDPNGNIVYGPIFVNPGSENIMTHQEAFNGPVQIVGPGGYNAMHVQPSDLQSAGWISEGNFYIEFNNETNDNEVLIDYWDITVSSNVAGTPQAHDGRIWSFNWAFFALNDYGFPQRPFNGAFYVCAPDPEDNDKAFITKIDFNNSGFRPAAFNVAFNSFGSINSGNVAIDRRSVELQNATRSEYAIFLNDPIDICETAIPGELELIDIGRCSPGEYCIQFSVSKEGLVELLLDFDGGDNIYTPGSADVFVSRQVAQSEINLPLCMEWNGLDGLGNPIPESVSTTIPVTISFAQGIYHFPIYDAEYMTNGFQITKVRPSGTVPLLYYDDSQISQLSGSGEPRVQLTGCALPCHRWTNFVDGATAGFGNFHTINSWWFSQQLIEEELFLVPEAILCAISGIDTICGQETDTLFASMSSSPSGTNSPIVLNHSWSGPGITVPITDDFIIVDQGGQYIFSVEWINNLGDTCRTSCEKFVIAEENCCSPSLTCSEQETLLNCDDDLPISASSIDDLINSGLLSVQDRSCANLKFQVDLIEQGDGCLGNPKEYIYAYHIFDDANNNDVPDSDELFVLCNHVYYSIDTIKPTIEFTGNLQGYSSGDTVQIECNATDTNWSVPMPSIDDVLTSESCGGIEIAMLDSLVATGNCLSDNFIRLYKCIWVVTDDCGNSDNIVLYMQLIDSEAPTLNDFPPDITLTCAQEIPDPLNQAFDNCDCVELQTTIDTIYFQCAADYQLNRKYEYSDHCGNTTYANQLITIFENETLHLDIPDELNVSEISVTCQNGTIPFEIAELNEHSITATSTCGSARVNFHFELIEGSNCSAGYLNKYRLTWTVTDDCQRELSHQLIVNLVDDIPPTIVEYPVADCSGHFNPDDIQVEDNCGINRIVHTTTPLPTTCTNMTILHQWEIIDFCGNSTFGQWVEYAGDDSPPEILVRSPYDDLARGDFLELPCTVSLSDVLNSNFFIVTDSCSDVELSITSDQIEETNCQLNQYALYAIVARATDVCNNESTFEFFVRILLPTIENILPDEVQKITCTEIQDESIKFTACGIDAELEFELLDVTCESNQAYQAYIFTTPCGQTYRDTIYYEIQDDEPPVFNELPSTICSTDDLPIALAWDACQSEYVPVAVRERQIEACGQLFFDILTFYAMDKCGNESSHDVLIIPPSIEENLKVYYGDILLEQTNGEWPQLSMSCLDKLDESLFRIEPICAGVKLNYNINSAFINCYQSDIYKQDYIDIQLSTACGIIKEVELIVNRIDQHPPVFYTLPANVSIGCNDSISFPFIEAWDDCSEVTISREEIVVVSLPGKSEYLQRWSAADACGNSTIHERHVTQFEAPECAISSPDDIVCGEWIRIQSDVLSMAPPLTYAWELVQGECELIRHTAHDAYLDIQLLSAIAQVSLTVTDFYGCSSTCTIDLNCDYKPNDSTPSLKKAKIAQGTSIIYPNPAQNTVNIQAGEADIRSILLMNRIGQMQKVQLTAMRHSSQMDISSIPAGVYFLQIELVNGTVEKHKLLKY